METYYYSLAVVHTGFQHVLIIFSHSAVLLINPVYRFSVNCFNLPYLFLCVHKRDFW